ncbi:hypothetical protein JIN85_08370 [Luteolibacter pohnpeiensis]|uniref:Uncharacterized protein n=1 Tax=Luteolibacter pohnpeiensis TaxID=454153 RepID=A0A934VQS8_9BACT|nr:hypothetical protein [Luteolibacter pohnpeiensis]MBK1882426.1 hypothetical protein [Luteolibacter pohnpeiensis]
MEKVRVYVADRPAEVRQLLERSTIWPLATETISISSNEDAPTTATLVDHLPGHPLPSLPENGWDLLDRAAEMEKLWLDQLHADSMGDLLCIGSSCRIHPEAKLIPPYFIGDDVLIGPDCEIGPYAVISQGALLAGANQITRSHVSPHSYLGPVTALEDCLLVGSTLFNRRNRARIDRIEAHIASDLSGTHPVVPLKDRLLALKLYLTSRSSQGSSPETFHTFDGLDLRGNPGHGLQVRRSWLPLVWKGKMQLFGVLPRSREQFESLSPDWQNIISHATVGVFSYADCQGCHSPDEPDEALHAVYQAALPPATLRSAIIDFTRNLKPADLSPS